ncbi:MAG: hypothetical protein Q8L34_03605 [Candidatus Woesearchaeota archaeon]|nr:hypothetical protein [Candidatus Woesearchaeota archaeon]
MSFNHFIKELNGNRVEGELLKSVFYSLLTSFAILALLYFFKFRFIENFTETYGLYLFLAALSYALLTPLMHQVHAYKQFSCMSGMMIGMTAGMIAGFLASFYVGATNGMFYGSVFGMIIGISLGIWMGSCCGVMGFLEGIMAGFMGGLMGGMTAIMLLNDHLQTMAIIVFLVGGAILVALNYMIYYEMKEAERQRQGQHLLIITITAALTLATTWLMIFGPRSALFS